MIQIKHKETGKVLYEVDRSSLSGARMVHQFLRNADFRGKRMHKVRLSGADCMYGNFNTAVLTNSICVSTSFAGAFGRLTDFEGADLYMADFHRAEFTNANFDGCDLQRVDFTDANLRGSSFVGANVGKADFRGAYINGASFVGCRNMDQAIFSS